jgi:glucose 1-dehydrogenase
VDRIVPWNDKLKWQICAEVMIVPEESVHMDAERSRIAVVTGGGQGIGRATAQVLAEAGYFVAIWDLNGDLAHQSAKEIAAGGGRELIGWEVDVADAAQVGRAAAMLVKEVGVPSVLVNNAGVVERGALEAVAVSAWNRVVAVQLGGTVHCTQAIGRYMLQQGTGSIVNLGSIAGLLPQPLFGAHSATKAGIIMLTKQTAVEWGPRGIRCNCISPGMIRTAASEAVYAHPELGAERRRFVPCRRIGEPRDIALVVRFLASADAQYINGENLVVDGGLSINLIGQWPAADPKGGFVQHTS